jgi:hypothetical protein
MKEKLVLMLQKLPSPEQVRAFVSTLTMKHVNLALIAFASAELALIGYLSYNTPSTPVAQTQKVAQKTAQNPARLLARTRTSQVNTQGARSAVERARDTRVASRPPQVKPYPHRRARVASAPRVFRQSQRPFALPKRYQAGTRSQVQPQATARAVRTTTPVVKQQAVSARRANAAPTRQRNVASIKDSRRLAPRKTSAKANSLQHIEREIARAPSHRPSLASELNLTRRQAWVLTKRHQRLRADLQRADQKGASGMKRILVNDHMAWAKEFLGEERFEIYRERSRLLAAAR